MSKSHKLLDMLEWTPINKSKEVWYHPKKSSMLDKLLSEIYKSLYQYSNHSITTTFDTLTDYEDIWINKQDFSFDKVILYLKTDKKGIRPGGMIVGLIKKNIMGDDVWKLSYTWHVGHNDIDNVNKIMNVFKTDDSYWKTAV